MLVARRDQLEEETGGVGLEGQIADLVDHEQWIAPQPCELLGKLAPGVSLAETSDPVAGGGEQDPMAL